VQGKNWEGNDEEKTKKMNREGELKEKDDEERGRTKGDRLRERDDWGRGETIERTQGKNERGW
jgi:hypothetical protein